jgi:hypothetical protein
VLQSLQYEKQHISSSDAVNWFPRLGHMAFSKQNSLTQSFSFSFLKMSDR